jgi:hypothetical protein
MRRNEFFIACRKSKDKKKVKRYVKEVDEKAVCLTSLLDETIHLIGIIKCLNPMKTWICGKSARNR